MEERYRRLELFTDAYPLPRIEDTVDVLADMRLFSTLDLKSGYWQVELDPADAVQILGIRTSMSVFEKEACMCTCRQLFWPLPVQNTDLEEQ